MIFTPRCRSYRWYVGDVVGDRWLYLQSVSQGSRALIWIIGSLLLSLIGQWS